MPLTRLPVAVYLGPGHVLAHVNETWRTVFDGDPPIGVPAREAFLDDMWPLFVDAMDRAWRTGEKQYVPCPDHHSTVVVLPVMEQGAPVAIVTACGLERIARMPAARPLPLTATVPAEATPDQR